MSLKSVWTQTLTCVLGHSTGRTGHSPTWPMGQLRGISMQHKGQAPGRAPHTHSTHGGLTTACRRQMVSEDGWRAFKIRGNTALKTESGLLNL